MEWLANNESSLSAIAAIIAIIAGVAVVARLIWTRMPSQVMGQVKRPAFLSDWRNIALIVVTLIALLLVILLAISTTDNPQTSTHVARLTEFTGKPSVAVLPLNYISEDQSQAYLADAISEDVITLLSRNPRFFVIARNSSFTYKGQAVDIREVGEELGVQYVVEGSLSKVGDRLRVTIQLIDTGNGQHVWAEQYDRAFANIFELQDAITKGIAVALGDEIYLSEIARASNISTNNLDAWGLMMRANRSYVTFNKASMSQAIPLFRAALVLDPNYTLAKAELARALCYRRIHSFSDHPEQDIAEAYLLGKQALEKAPGDPLILFTVGSCYGYTGRRSEAIRLMEKAIAKQPHFAEALAVLGSALSFDMQADKGMSSLDEALTLSPKSPHRYWIQNWRAVALNQLGRHAEAEQAVRDGLKTYDGYMWLWVHLAHALAAQGDANGAIRALFEAKKVEPTFSLNLVKEATSFVYKNKGVKLLTALEPIWPPDLLTADETNKN